MDLAAVSGRDAPAVRVTAFRKRYGDRIAVRDVGFTLGAREIFGLVGPDGAGKTSLMKAVAGVLTFDAGEVEVLGVGLRSERDAERVKDRIGFMPQGLGLNLYPNLSVDENIDFFAHLRGVKGGDLETRKRRLLGMTRLERFRDRAMKHLSGGMKQKLGLACTLVHDPDLVVLDEPTTGVDPVSRREFWQLLTELLEERGISALISTAYLDEASRFHRLALLFEGRELASGDPRDVLRLAPGSLVALRVPEGAQIAAVDRLRASFSQVDAYGSRVRVYVDGADASEAIARVRFALGEHRLETVDVDEPELEDVVVALLRRDREHAIEAAGAEDRPLPALGSPTREGRAQSPHLAIEAAGLSRDFGGFRAVDRATFRVRPGEIFGLLGANGAGKTTVIKMLTGILAPTAGRGQVAGADIQTAGAAIKRRIGYVSQAFSLYTDLSVAENIELYAGLYGLGRAETRVRLAFVTKLGGLGEHLHTAASRLPIGLRQRLALGCALVHRPEVLFLDEPTSGVDPIGRRRFWDILTRLSREEGVAVLVTTHFMSEAEHCDRLALMFAGRIVADAPPDRLKRDAERDRGALLEIAAEPPGRALALLRAGGFDTASLFGRRVHVMTRDPARDAEHATALLSAAGLQVLGAEPRPYSMEDVFVSRITSLEHESDEASP